ncbi:MAG TPA: alpha amylase C-terminal domain-containing protein, partial [Humisphaera sp.]|nr:alpha amylase C-terminal domain-containing protein [Humisphaera sp.]
SYTDLRVPVPDPKDYLLELDTDAKPFEGQGRIVPGMAYPWQHVPCFGRNQSVQIYLPSRSAQVLAPG